jgi:hypothetical protein
VHILRSLTFSYPCPILLGFPFTAGAFGSSNPGIGHSDNVSPLAANVSPLAAEESTICFISTARFSQAQLTNSANFFRA